MLRFGTFLLALMVQSSPVPESTATIGGTVVHFSSRQPVAMATVELTVVQGGRVLSQTTTTSEEGTFVFNDLRPLPGYQLVVSGAGLRPTGYGQRNPRSPWVPIDLSPDQHLSVEIAAQSLTQISGRIRDRSGSPLAGATVAAMRPNYSEGRRVLEQGKSSVTNLRGEYRISGLSPGVYYLRINPQNETNAQIFFTNPAAADRSAADRSTRVSEFEGYPTTFFPGGPIELAEAIYLQDGDNRQNIDVTLRKTKTSRLRGMLANSATGVRITSAQVFLFAAGKAPESVWSRFTSGTDGEFDFRAVQPGDYSLIAVSSSTDGPLYGRMPVELKSGQSRNLTLSLSKGSDLAGRITFDSSENKPSAFSGLTISLTSDQHAPIDSSVAGPALTLPAATVAVRADGTFSLRGVIPWDYQVGVSHNSDMYVKSIRRGDVDVLLDGLHVVGNEGGDLEVVLGSDAGSVSGRIVVPTSIAPGVRIALVPEQRARRDLYRVFEPTSDGSFDSGYVPPGRYTVLAWDIVPEGAWIDPDFLKTFESRGSIVEILPRSKTSIEVPLLPLFGAP